MFEFTCTAASLTQDLQIMAINTGILTWGAGLFYFICTRYEKAQKRHWAKRRAERAKAARQHNR